MKVKQAGPYERKIEKVYQSIDKKSFLDRLKQSNICDIDNEEKDKSWSLNIGEFDNEEKECVTE